MTTHIAAERFPAGEHLAEELEARGWTQVDFAEILGRPPQFVSEIISGKKEITRESAAQIAAALGTSPEFWLNLQDSYLLWVQDQDQNTQQSLSEVKKRARLQELAPITLLRKRGFITAASVDGQTSEILHLFGMKSLDEQPHFKVAARRSNTDEKLSVLQNAWVACVRAVAAKAKVPSYSSARLKAVAQKLPGLSRQPESLAGFPQLFSEAGVKLVYVEAFPGGKFDGCAFLGEDKSPVIGVSGRGKRLDKVLFTIFHEIAHILLDHLKPNGEAIIDDLKSKPGRSDDLEAEADELAAELAIPGGPPAIPGRINMGWVEREAAQINVHPVVLIGRLQNDEQLAWNSSLARGMPTATKQLEKWHL